MIKNIFISVFIFFGLVSYAKHISVDNSDHSVAMFTDLQSAVDFAVTGDTIMINSSGKNYLSFDVDKRLIFIGEGFASRGGAKKTYLERIDFTDPLSSASVFKSLHIQQLNVDDLETGETIDAIQFEGVFFNDGFSIHGNGWRFVNCNINFTLTLNNYSTNFFNSVIESNVNGGNGVNRFENCVFTNKSASLLSSSVVNASFVNCVIDYYTSAANKALTSSSNYRNCLFHEALDSTKIASSFNTFEDCKFEETIYIKERTDFQPTDDSPLLNAGVGGTDIGLTGGPFPIKILNGENYLPEVTELFIETSVIRPGDPIKFKVSGSRKEKP